MRPNTEKEWEGLPCLVLMKVKLITRNGLIHNHFSRMSLLMHSSMKLEIAVLEVTVINFYSLKWKPMILMKLRKPPLTVTMLQPNTMDQIMNYHRHCSTGCLYKTSRRHYIGQLNVLGLLYLRLRRKRASLYFLR